MQRSHLQFSTTSADQVTFRLSRKTSEISLSDTRSPSQRRHIMKSVGQKNTGPELVVRRLLHRMGYRYFLHRKDLPGTPDIVFPGKKKAIFVHGCYWHGHGCSKGMLPKSRLEYWAPKIAKNRARDVSNVDALTHLGWRVLTIWQCEIRNSNELAMQLQQFLSGN
ncbi:very short patch repair endonuclease [Telluria beijingensis]|uniref:very short patch repair endonuclease n=1 Tax=Telluria beijingensis TaxID=3068633 RepID=UPI0027959377|nr:very short patch repair endonuclease [Massilia sp. REN29]